MGYESKLYFVRAYDFGADTSKCKLHAADIVATLDMSKMGYGYYDEVTQFVKMFDTKTPFCLYILDYDDEKECECYMEVTEDKYGDRLCYCKDKAKLLRQANKIIKCSEERGEGYYRYYYMRNMIKAFKDMDDVYIVHYGY